MAEKLYTVTKLPGTGRKFYQSTLQPRHVKRGFRRASDAEAHTRRLRERLERLRAAARAKTNGAGIEA